MCEKGKVEKKKKKKETTNLPVVLLDFVDFITSRWWWCVVWRGRRRCTRYMPPRPPPSSSLLKTDKTWGREKANRRGEGDCSFWIIKEIAGLLKGRKGRVGSRGGTKEQLASIGHMLVRCSDSGMIRRRGKTLCEKRKAKTKEQTRWVREKIEKPPVRRGRKRPMGRGNGHPVARLCIEGR